VRGRGLVRVVAALALGIAAFAGPASGTGAEAERVHVVRPGDTLWRIAADALGDPHRWPELYRANRDQIADPAVIFPGQRLRIPPEAAGARGGGAARGAADAPRGP